MTERVLLPTNVVPSEYDIKLTPNFKDFTFSGNEDVKLKVVSPTDKIVLHSLDVKINGGKVLREGKAVASVSDVAYEKETERATLTLDTKLDAGDVVLQLEFVGELNDKMAGFYRSKYTTDDGEERYAATTQFEPTDARRAFPCWDEPALKAKFSITLTVPKDRVALSNMPGKVVSSDDSTQTYAFEQTPIMSTYLVAFVVGEFDYVETTTKKNVLMRVYTPVGKKEQGQFALDCGAKILDYYDDYFGVAYPLPKLDMIAIADFSAGAMENWGLVTYRSTAVLIDEKNSGLSSRQRVAYVVAHELAHQWFGNLVTMEWWKELWLNEGFATFVGNQATDFLFPDWDIWTSFQSDYTNRALQSDALESSHPIEVDVASSSQVNEIFDAISYCKGAAVIRMIADHVGEDAMKKGLNAYINKHAYNNAVTTDLWEALSAASGKDVAAFMSRWTQKMGYPCVKVSLVDGEYKIEQARFLASGAKGDDDGQWHLSLRVVAEGGAKHTITTSQKETKVQLPPALNNAKWVKFNAGQPGFFRVAYSDGLLAQLAAGVSTQEIAPVDRLAVQADAFALAIAGHMKTSAALNLALSYQNETVYSVWSDLTASIGTVASVWQDDPAAPGIAALRRKLYAPLGARLGWVAKEGEPPLDALLRAVALAQLVKANHTETVAEARRQFDLWATSIESGKEQENALAVDLRHTISMAAVRYGDEKDWERVQALYRKVEMQEEKIRLMRALAATKDEKLVKRTFEWGLSDDVRNQDLFYVVGTLAAVNRDQTWELFKTNWDEFYKRFGEGQFLLARIVGQVTGGFVTTERADEVEAFFNEHKCEAAARTIKQSLEAIRSNAAWLQRDRAGVAKWLSDEGLLEGFVGGVH